MATTALVGVCRFYDSTIAWAEVNQHAPSDDIAVERAKSGTTRPWPDGAIIGKVVWKDAQSQDWQAVTGPGGLVHAEFMFRDPAKEPKATQGLPSYAQGFLPCGQTAVRFLLACPRLGKSSEASGTKLNILYGGGYRPASEIRIARMAGSYRITMQLHNARVATSADGLKECVSSTIDELAVRREFRVV